MDRGVLLEKLGRRDEALAAFDRVLAIHPNHAWAHLYRGLVFEKQGHADGAREAYARALDLGLRTSWLLTRMASALATDPSPGNRARAVELMSEAVKLDPQHGPYNAACASALAAARGGETATAWRCRALEWLRGDLAAREKAGLASTIEEWKSDTDLASVRDRIDDLPEPEREAWSGLWAAVDRALAASHPQAK
jgi:tetratricopeptide (TPR) repeat protein